MSSAKAALYDDVTHLHFSVVKESQNDLGLASVHCKIVRARKNFLGFYCKTRPSVEDRMAYLNQQ